MKKLIPSTPDISDDVEHTPEVVYDLDYLLDAALTDVYEWYGDVLPTHLNAGSFPRFAIRSRELAHKVVNLLPMVIDPKAQTAYTDGKTIFLPSIFMLDKFYEFYWVPEEHRAAAACLLINGVQVHEALHCLLTTFGLDNFCKVSGVAKSVEYVDKFKGFLDCINIIEDQFIEAHCRKYFRALATFVDGKNEVILGNVGLKLTLEEMTKQCEAEGRMPGVDEMLGMMGFAKNLNLRWNPQLEFIYPLLEITDRATDPDLTLTERATLAVELWEKLMDLNGGEENCEGSKATQDWKDEGKPETIDRDTLMSIIAEALGAGEISDKEALDAAQELMEALEAEIAEEESAKGKDGDAPLELSGDKERRKTSTDIHLGADVIRNIPNMIVKDIMQASPVHMESEAHPSREWEKFGTYLRYMRQTKNTPGRPTDRGAVIVANRLARIIIDNKVLAKRNRQLIKRGRPEVILLGDASGSMRGHSGASGESLFIDVVDAMYGMFIALMKSGIPVSVYAHTSTPHSNLAPLLYNVSAFRMPVFTSTAITNTDYHQRFARLAKISCVENFDGMAIAKVGSEFTKTEGTKILVVLSDGAPVGGGLYGGSSARQHTQGAIAKLRHQGKHVISVSLVPSVVETNNRIYGEDYNLEGFGLGLERTLQMMAAQLARPIE